MTTSTSRHAGIPHQSRSTALIHSTEETTETQYIYIRTTQDSSTGSSGATVQWSGQSAPQEGREDEARGSKRHGRQTRQNQHQQPTTRDVGAITRRHGSELFCQLGQFLSFYFMSLFLQQNRTCHLFALVSVYFVVMSLFACRFFGDGVLPAFEMPDFDHPEMTTEINMDPLFQGSFSFLRQGSFNPSFWHDLVSAVVGWMRCALRVFRATRLL